MGDAAAAEAALCAETQRHLEGIGREAPEERAMRTASAAPSELLVSGQLAPVAPLPSGASLSVGIIEHRDFGDNAKPPIVVPAVRLSPKRQQDNGLDMEHVIIDLTAAAVDKAEVKALRAECSKLQVELEIEKQISAAHQKELFPLKLALRKAKDEESAEESSHPLNTSITATNAEATNELASSGVASIASITTGLQLQNKAIRRENAALKKELRSVQEARAAEGGDTFTCRSVPPPAAGIDAVLTLEAKALRAECSKLQAELGREKRAGAAQQKEILPLKLALRKAKQEKKELVLKGKQLLAAASQQRQPLTHDFQIARAALPEATTPVLPENTPLAAAQHPEQATSPATSSMAYAQPPPGNTSRPLANAALPTGDVVGTTVEWWRRAHRVDVRVPSRFQALHVQTALAARRQQIGDGPPARQANASAGNLLPALPPEPPELPAEFRSRSIDQILETERRYMLPCYPRLPTGHRVSLAGKVPPRQASRERTAGTKRREAELEATTAEVEALQGRIQERGTQRRLEGAGLAAGRAAL